LPLTSGRGQDTASCYVLTEMTRYLEEHRELNFDDCEAIARIFVGTLIHHIITQEILQGKEIMPITSDRLMDSLISLIVN